MEGKLPVSESQVINEQWKCNIFFSSCMSFFRARFEYYVSHAFFFYKCFFFFYMMINNFFMYVIAVGVY